MDQISVVLSPIVAILLCAVCGIGLVAWVSRTNKPL